MARNQYEGACRDCGKPVAAGAGYFHKNRRGSLPKWSVRCMACVVAGKLARGDGLSDAQRKYQSEIRASSTCQWCGEQKVAGDCRRGCQFDWFAGPDLEVASVTGLAWVQNSPRATGSEAK